MKPLILIFGSMGAGKSTLAKKLSEELYLCTFSVDKMRLAYSNGKFSGEYRAWSEFLRELESGQGIFECSGVGRHAHYVQLILKEIPEASKFIIHLECHVSDSKVRVETRDKPAIPFPYKMSMDDGINAIDLALKTNRNSFSILGENYLYLNTTDINEEEVFKQAMSLLNSKGVSRESIRI